jgi:hypothetical protein
MATTYSTDLKLAIMATGENAGTWGQITNTNLNLLQQSITGYQSVSIAGGAQTTALTMLNGAISNARNAVIKLTGTITGNQVVTIPDGISKVYTVVNGTSGAFTVQFKTVSGTGVTWATTDKTTKIIYSDGTNVINTGLLAAIVYDTSPKLGGDLDVNGNSIITASGSNANLNITPDGTGDVYLNADIVRVGDSAAAATLTTNGAGDLTVNTNSGSNAGSIVLTNGANGNITLTPNGIGKVALVGGGKIKSLAETTTVSASAAGGTINFDTITQAVLYYTVAANAAFKVNLRGSSTVSLNSYMATGESITVAFLATQGGTAYYTTNVQIDGTNITPLWQGGSTPTQGNASATDVYTYTAIKTATSTFTVLASQTQFK